MATDDDAIQTSEDFAARKLAEQDKTSDAPKPPDTSTPASDKRSYRSYEEYPWEGHSSQYGPLNNPLGEGYGIGLGPVLQERYNAPVGSWVYVPPYGWRQVNETSAAKGGEGIELFTKTKGSVPEQLAIEAVSHSTPEGQTPAPGMDGKLHMASGYNLDYPATREPNQAEGLYGAEEAEAQIGEAELKELEDKQAKENDNPLSPQSVVRTLKSQNADYKDVPDQKLYQAFKQRYPGGVDQLTALYPDYKTVDTGVLLKAVKERWYPNDNNDEFIDRMQPTNVLHNISEQLPRIVPSFYEHTANLAKTPENFATFMSPILRALGIDPGKGTPDWLKTLGIDPAHNVQIRGYTGADAGGDAQRKITQGLYNWATRFATKGKKWEDAHHMPKPHEVIGQTTANISGALGAAPEAAISFLPLGGSVTLGRVVIPHVVGLAIGMGYDALQAYSKYREAGMDKALLQSSEGATVRFLEQFLAYTPRGRILSAFFYHGAGWAGVATADQEAKTFIDNWGKPKEQQITLSANDRISTAATAWLLGGLFSLTAERMPEAAQESLSEAVQARDAGNQALQATLLDRTMYLLPDAQRKAVGNNLLAWRNEAIEAKPGDAPMEMPGARGFQIIKPSEVNLPRAPQAPIEGAIEARPLDQPQPPGVILAPWHAREQAPSPFTAERVGADPARVEPGIGSLELGEVPLKREEAPKVEEAKPTEVKAPAPKIEPSAKGVRAVQIPAVSPELEQVPFDPEKGQLEHLEHLRSLQPPRSPLSPIPRRGRGVDDVPRGTKSPSDHITDQLYYSGIDLRLLSKLAEDIGETELGRWLQASGTKARNWGGIARDLFSPEHVTPAREASAAVIGRNIGVMQRDQQRIMQTWWQQQKLHDDIRFAYSADRRSAFWQSRKRGELMTWLERHESGRSTGNPVADRMFKQHDALMGWLNTLEQQQGFVHGIRDSYIYHALENPGDIGALSETLKKNGWADPDFMHHRELPTIEDVHRFGFRLKTYNLEKLDQMRFESYLRTKMKADTLDWLRTAKLAYTDRDFANMRISLEAQGKAIGMAPDEVDARIDKFIGSLKSQTQEWRSPRAVKNVSTGELEHERFWVLGTKTDGPSFMLHRATDPVQWSIFEPVVNGALTIKQRTTAPVLGWSAYHHLHMLPIMASDTITHALHQTLRGRATLEDWKWASADAFSLGLATHIRSLYENQKVLNVYLHPGEVRYKDLSPYEQKVFTLWERGGFVPQISHERQIALGQFLIGQKGLNVDKVADLGYAALTCRPYQRWLFGRSIPSMKAHAYTQRTFALLDARPELNRSENWLKLDIELRKIAREVDDRFGEQNLRQSFTSPYVKTLGQAYFLSYSWQKSFLGVNGGAIHDLTKVPRHFQEILKGTPEERAGIISNKLLYGMTMNLYTMGVNLLISQLLGAGVKSLVDAIYPNIGYDGQGRLKRSKPPFWVTTEIAGLTRHLGDDGLVFGALGFFANKQQAALSTLFSLIANRDYFGTQISPQGAALGFIPKDAPPFSTKWWNEMGEQLWTKAEFALKNEISMSVQQALQPGMTWRDRLLGFAGIARAPSSAERSAVENEIIHTWVATKAPRERTREAGQQIEAKHNYRVALLSKDQWSIDIAREQMRRLGISEDSMAAIEDHLDVSTAENLFPKLYPEDQERILRSMHQDDFSKFYDLASEDVQDKVSNFHPSK